MATISLELRVARSQVPTTDIRLDRGSCRPAELRPGDAVIALARRSQAL
jgi:hypothetical protein